MIDAVFSCLKDLHEDLVVAPYRKIEECAQPVLEPLARTKDLFVPALRHSRAAIGFVANRAAVQAFRVKNLIFYRGAHQRELDTAVKGTRRAVVASKEQMAKHLDVISSLGSSVFETDFILPPFLDTENIERLRILFHQALSRNPPPEKRELIERALVEVDALRTLSNGIEQSKEEAINAEDMETIYDRLSHNVVFMACFAASMENIGEFCGAQFLECLPAYLNPAALSSGLLQHPATAALVSIAALLRVRSQLPDAVRDRLETLSGMIAATGLSTLAYYYFLGPYLGDLGYYGVSLLFSYLGMYAAGTGETLPEYVQKMTPSMLTWNASSLALDVLGVPRLLSLPLSFYASHVAYNTDAYYRMWQGTLLQGCTSQGLSQHSLALLASRGMKEGPSAKACKKIYKIACSRLNAHQRNFSVSMFDRDISLLITPLSLSLSLQGIPVPLMTIRGEDFVSKLPDLFEQALQGSPLGTALRQRIDEIHEGMVQVDAVVISPLVAVLVREFIRFSELLETPKWKTLLGNYKARLMETIDRSMRADYLDHVQPPQQRVQLEYELLKEILFDSGIPREVLDSIPAEIGTVLSEKLHEMVEPHAQILEGLIERKSAQLLPCSYAESACAVKTVTLFFSLFAAHFAGRIAGLDPNVVKDVLPVSDREMDQVVKHLSTFVLETRLPRSHSFLRTLVHGQLSGSSDTDTEIT